MSFLQKFIKPKWQHKDPRVRKESLLALDRDQNQAIIEQLARTDPDNEIRQIAVKRVNDADILIDLANNDSDTNVRDAATKLLTQILIGQNDAYSNEQRLALLSRIDNSRIIESVARDANSIDLRLKAFQRLDKPSLFIEFAVNDTNSDIRQAALARVADKKGLERVVKLAKNKDKHIYRDAKARLEAIIAEEEKPLRIKEERKRILVTLEGLGRRGNWDFDIQMFDRLQNEWDNIEGECEAELANRYQNARTQFSTAYQQYSERNAEQIEQEKKWKSLKELKQSVIDRFGELLRELDNLSFADDQIIIGVNARYQDLSAEWEFIESLPAATQATYDTLFREVTTKIRKRISDLEANTEVYENLRSIQEQLKSVEALSGGELEHRLKSIQRFFDRVKSHIGTDQLSELRDSIESQLTVLTEKVSINQKTVADLTMSVNELIKQQKEFSQTGKLNDALETAKKIRHEIKKITDLDRRLAEKLSSRARQASKDLNELNDWRKWVSTPKKQELIDQVESLVGSNEDPHEIARLIQNARDAWQKLGSSESSKELWERFNEVCNKAYEPCLSAFEKEASEREESRVRRETFLNKLEAFLNTADWLSVDWKKVERLLNDSREEWRNLGATDRKIKKSLTERYQSAIDQLRDRITQNWATNLPLKQAIVDETKRLLDVSDTSSAVNKAKELQRKWPSIGRVSQKDEHRLWQEFREACNAIFQKRDQARSEHAQQLDKYADQKETICRRLEQIEELPDDEFLSAMNEIRILEENWKNIPDTHKNDNQKFEKRFRDTLSAIERMKLIKQRRQQLRCVEHACERVAICEELQMAFNDGTPVSKAEMLKRWDSAAAVDRVLADMIETRFRTLLDLTTNPRQTDKNIESSEHKVRELIVRYEILAEIDSPAEYQQDRINYQMGRLANDIGKGVQIDPWQELLRLELDWVFVRNTPIANDEKFTERRERALAALANVFPDELNQYA